MLMYYVLMSFWVNIQPLQIEYNIYIYIYIYICVCVCWSSVIDWVTRWEVLQPGYQPTNSWFAPIGHSVAATINNSPMNSISTIVPIFFFFFFLVCLSWLRNSHITQSVNPETHRLNVVNYNFYYNYSWVSGWSWVVFLHL